MTAIAEYKDQLGEEALRMITDALPALIAQVDCTERYIFNNQTYEDWFGLPSSQVVGRTIRETLGDEVYQPLRKRIAAAFSGKKQIFRGIIRHQTLGDRVMQIYYIPRFDEAGAVAGLYILMADITENRRTEEQVMRLVNTANEGILEFDIRGEIVYANARMTEMLGYAAEEVKQKHWSELVFREDLNGAEMAWKSRLRGIADSRESRLRRKDGSPIWTTISSSPVRDEQGKINGVLAMVTDVTQRKSAEEEIRRLNADLERRVAERTAQLQAINQELEAFCYSVSHDLRAPLRAVRGFAEVLREQHAAQLDARGKDFLLRTCEASSHMEKLINDLLRLSRVSRTEFQSADVNLSLLAQDIVADLKQNDPAREVTFQIQPDLRARGDERLLRQTLDNLLRNAWKFTSKCVQARIAFHGVPGQSGTFCVRDNGAGFDMAYVSKLFCVFQRLHSTSEYPGTGVGLAIVQRIINRHGGRTWAEGKINGGAAFYFTLPA